MLSSTLRINGAASIELGPKQLCAFSLFPHKGFSLAWLNGDTLLATGGGHLVEIGIGPAKRCTKHLAQFHTNLF
jgi:hypothetical protein